MISSSNEYVPLVQPIPIDGEVEVWLNQLENIMRITLDSSLKQCQSSENGLDIANMPS